MESLSDTKIPISVANEQRHFRLVELTPDIVELLEQPDPPPLYFKSALTTNTGSSGPSAPNAVLCTQTRTYDIRQVQTSNSVLILEPSSAPNRISSEVGSNDDATTPTIPGLRAIASCPTTLELHPQAPTSTPLAHLTRTLPLYTHPSLSSSSSSSSPQPSLSSPSTKSSILSSTPFSLAQCEASWLSLLAFTHPTTNQCMRPTTHTLSLLWTSLLTLSLAEQHPLSTPSGWAAARAALLEAESWPADLLDALSRRLSSSPSSSEEEEDAGGVLDRGKCVAWTGMLCLELLSADGGVTEERFLEGWREMLPEGWRGNVGMGGVARELYSRPRPGMVRWKGPDGDDGDAGGGEGGDEGGDAGRKKGGGGDAAAASKKKNWHERFKSKRLRKD